MEGIHVWGAGELKLWDLLPTYFSVLIVFILTFYLK